MSTQQGSYNTYIGARYVPIFNGTWNNSKKYEPLVIVEYQGNSYTSKTYVPIGIDINNTEYWALTGNYNAQVEAYRQEVEQLKQQVNDFGGEIDTIETELTETTATATGAYNASFKQTNKKKAVFFGDSLTVGDMGGSSHIIADKPYPTIYGEISGLEITNSAFGGSTAANNQSVPNNQHYLQVQIDATDFTQYDQMFIAHGANDWSFSSPMGTLFSTDINTFYGAYNKAIQQALSQNPKIEIILITTFYAQSSQHKEAGTVMQPQFNNANYTVYDYNEAIKNIAGNYNLRCVDMLDALGVNDYNYSAYLNDDVHMNQDGYTMVGYYLAKQLSFPKPENVYSAIQLGKEHLTPNMVNIIDFDQYGIGGFDPHRDYKCGATVSLVLGGSQTTVRSRQKYHFVQGQQYSFHCNMYIEPKVAITIQLNNAESGAQHICAFGHTQNVNNLFPIHTTFVPNFTGDASLDMVITPNGSDTGRIAISDICMNEGLRPNYHELGNNFLNNVFWKESYLGGSVTSNASNPFMYMLDNAGIVHFQGQVDCALAPDVEREVIGIPLYFTPLRDCYFTVPTTTGIIATVKMNVANGRLTILPNTQITGAYTLDLTGVTFSALRQYPLIEAPLVPTT